MKNLFFFLLVVLIFSSCNESYTKQHSKKGKYAKDSLIQVSWFEGDPGAIVDLNATAQVIGRGFNWAE